MKNIFSFIIGAALIVGCASSEKQDDNKNLKKGAGIGAGAGAVLGGIIGNQQGNSAKGAVIGGVLGSVVGGHMGHRMDEQAKELNKVAETKRTEEGLITKMKSDILFDTGKADLKASAKEDLKQMAEIMKKYPEDVLTVNGYTDDTGSSRINESLSQKRAEAVKSALVAQGVPASTVETKGWGPANPAAPNDSPAGRQKNRRVEIQVRADESKVPQQK